jgi:hypothetical protein
MSVAKEVKRWSKEHSDRVEALIAQLESDLGTPVSIDVKIAGQAEVHVGPFGSRPLTVTTTSDDHKALAGEYKDVDALKDKIDELVENYVNCAGPSSFTCPRCRRQFNSKPYYAAEMCACGAFARIDVMPTWFGVEVDLMHLIVKHDHKVIATISMKCISG